MSVLIIVPMTLMSRMIMPFVIMIAIRMILTRFELFAHSVLIIQPLKTRQGKFLSRRRLFPAGGAVAF
jgi:hypothetical protein